MAHYHYCKVCKVPVAFCSDDSCKTDKDHANAAEEHFCSVHQPPNSRHYIPPTPPLKR
jgi:hypothetical protein